MLYKNGTDVKIGDLCMLPNGTTGRVVECKGELFQKSKFNMTKITNKTAIRLN